MRLEADLGVDGVVSGLVTADLEILVCLIVKVGVLSDLGCVLEAVVGVKEGEAIDGVFTVVLVF